MQPVAKGPFSVSIVLDHVEVSDGSFTLALTPGEADVAKGLLETVRKIKNFKVFPRKIESSPLEVHFLDGEEQECALVKPHAYEKKRCEFSFESADVLSQAIKAGTEMWLDNKKFGTADKSTFSKASAPDPLISGR